MLSDLPPPEFPSRHRIVARWPAAISVRLSLTARECARPERDSITTQRAPTSVIVIRDSLFPHHQHASARPIYSDQSPSTLTQCPLPRAQWPARSRPPRGRRRALRRRRSTNASSATALSVGRSTGVGTSDHVRIFPHFPDDGSIVESGGAHRDSKSIWWTLC